MCESIRSNRFGLPFNFEQRCAHSRRLSFHLVFKFVFLRGRCSLSVYQGSAAPGTIRISHRANGSGLAVVVAVVSVVAVMRAAARMSAAARSLHPRVCIAAPSLYLSLDCLSFPFLFTLSRQPLLPPLSHALFSYASTTFSTALLDRRTSALAHLPLLRRKI